MKVISASEIGEYYYCCVSWWLKQKGAKLQNPKDIEAKIKVEKRPKEKTKLIKQLQVAKKIDENLKAGIKRHEKIGKNMAIVEEQKLQVNNLKKIGWWILAIAVILLVISTIL